MAINLDVRATGFEGVHKVLNNLGDKIHNPDAHLMRRLGDTAVDDIEQRFMTRGYGTWPALRPETIARKKGNSMVLIDTGAMFSSIKITSLTNGRVSVAVPFGGKTHDPDVPRYHQRGGRRMPVRRIIEVTPRLVGALNFTLAQWIADMIKAYGKSV